LFRLNLETLKWEKNFINTQPLKDIFGFAVALSQNELYYFGGTNGKLYYNDIHCLKLDRIDILEKKREEDRKIKEKKG